VTDIYDPKKRSYVMSRVSGKDTKLEVLVRRALFKAGLRYRKHIKTLPGRPDIVFHKYKTAVFVHGCFWHGHQECKAARLPKSNITYWEQKIRDNIERDKRKTMALTQLGWKVIVIWQCEINTIEKRERRLLFIIKQIRNNR